MEPRQNGKGGCITARELAGLFLFGERLQTHTAHRFDTCLEGFHRIRELIDATPDLSRRVHKIVEAHGAESIELWTPQHGTQRLNFKARSKGSGRGFDGDVVYLDEIYYLLELGSLLPTMSARPNPQLWYLSSAPLPKVESDILRQLCKRGRRGARKRPSGRLAYFEWSATTDPGPEPVEGTPEEQVAWEAAHIAALVEANPGLGYRLSLEFSHSERGAMTHEEYARERLGIYPELDQVADPALPESDWRACATPTSTLVGSPVFVFDVSPDRRWSTIAVAGTSTLGGTHVEVVEHLRGTAWVVDRLVALRDAHRPSVIACLASGPAGALLAEAATAGLHIGVPSPGPKATTKYTNSTAADYARACGAAYDAVTSHRWRHIDQPELNSAAGAAQWRTTAAARVFDGSGPIDITPLAAVTLAAALVSTPGNQPSVYEEREMVTL